MKKPGVKLLNTLLAVGMLLIFSGFLLAVGFIGGKLDFTFSLLPVIISCTGLVFMYSYWAFSPTFLKLFVGLEFTLNGLFFIITTKCVSGFPISESWPVIVIISGVTLFVTGHARRKRSVFAFDFPALLLLILGFLFFLFSLDIIKIPFTTLALIAMPVIFIVSGLVLVILFFKRKSILEILPDDVSSDFSERALEESQVYETDVE